jgi:hypothetical protein
LKEGRDKWKAKVSKLDSKEECLEESQTKRKGKILVTVILVIM